VLDVELRTKASFLVLLLLDHRLLQQMRDYSNSGNPYQHCYLRPTVYSKTNLFLVQQERREHRMPDFKRMHTALAPSSSWPPSAPLHIIDTDEYHPVKPPRSTTATTSPTSTSAKGISLNLFEHYEYNTSATPMHAHTNLFDNFNGAPTADDSFLSHIIGSHSHQSHVRREESVKSPFSLDGDVDDAPKGSKVNLFDPTVSSSLDLINDDDPFFAALSTVHITQKTPHFPAENDNKPFDAFDQEVSPPIAVPARDPFSSILAGAAHPPDSSDPFAAILSSDTAANNPPVKPTKPEKPVRAPDPVWDF
jgi:hypothetical protein